MPFLTAHTINGTFIVPAQQPAYYTPEQLDKLAAGVYVLAFPSILAGLVVLFHGHWSYKDWVSALRRNLGSES